MNIGQRFENNKLHMSAGCGSTILGGCQVDEEHPFTAECSIRDALDKYYGVPQEMLDAAVEYENGTL